MKKFAPFILTFFLISFISSAQITLDQSDIVVPGDTIISISDTGNFSAYTGGTSGAKQVWDFSNIQNGRTDTSLILDPANTQYAADFTNANTAVLELNSDSNFFFWDVTATNIGFVGSVFELEPGNKTVLKSDPQAVLLTFPATHMTANTSQGILDLLIDRNDTVSTSPLIIIDSARITSVLDRRDTIDGFGLLTTPIGTYYALRQKSVEINNTNSDVLLCGPFGCSWTPFTSDADSTTNYSFYAKNQGFAVLEISIDSSGDVQDINYLLTNVPTVIVGFVANDAGLGTFSFVDTSFNSPYTWSWDFADGSNSAEQNPAHTYNNNGDYEVCLTATNDAGSDTYCDSITVTSVGIDEAAPGYIQVFPMPVNDLLNFKIPADLDSEMILTIYNNLGQLTYSSRIAAISNNGSSFQLNVSEFAEGMYFIHLTKVNNVAKGLGKMIIIR
ncbi:MAG: PKD domain-containing protein [Bacteroidetes bacterium]|nr:PKD domain-containing protein [Bacteroidota bacterium]